MLRCMETDPTPTIRDLYPLLTEKELDEAEANLEQYLALILHIFERMEMETNPQVNRLTANEGTLACTPPRSES
jgi:hypothetical protein